MNSATPRPSVERVVIAGPAGSLEGVVEAPRPGAAERVAVVCHPHPQYGGTMTNKVVHMLAKSFNELGATSIRFNYRGVGASEGSYDEGNGETDDALAVLDWAQRRWPQAQLWLGGFSFGGAVAIKAAAQRTVQRLVTVAPAIERVAVDAGELPRSAWLLVQGDRDELVDATQIQQWVATLQQPPDLVVLPGVDHFFHGRLNELREVVVRWLQDRNES
jgi:alpha/beta superfamily hydrolase